MARILILEDDAEFAELLSLDLRDMGHEADIIDSGFLALQMLADRDYDLLIADIFIWKDGQSTSDGGLLVAGRLRILRIMKRDDKRARIPVLAISGAMVHPGNEHILRVARNIGADDVLAKPFTPAELHEKIDALLASGPTNIEAPLRR
ncbi:response regulator transcription factor [Salipiger sp.]|uniref:response regulator transcription factor n=1 Tax=Salipiger sp. TaxID=2078585 RepID=UPI003A97511E